MDLTKYIKCNVACRGLVCLVKKPILIKCKKTKLRFSSLKN